MSEENKDAVNGDEVVDNNGAEDKTDAFGVKEEVAPVEKKEEAKINKYEAIPADHPVISSLQEQITKLSEDKGSMGSNLSKQNDIIKGLEKKITDIKGGKVDPDNKEDENVVYKDIKFSKDLTEAERDELTDTEIKQMDELAEIKTTQNKLYAESLVKETDTENKEVEDKNKSVQEFAKELATGEDEKPDVKVANSIIEKFKSLDFNLEGKTAEEIKNLVKISAEQVSDYKPAKEQKAPNAKTVAGTKTAEDPFGNDKIVEEATQPADGNYKL